MCTHWGSKLIFQGLYATVGCHPTRSGQFEKFKGGPDAYLQALDKLIESNLTGVGRVVAVGECGLGNTAQPFRVAHKLKQYQIMTELILQPRKLKRPTSVSLHVSRHCIRFNRVLGSQLALAKKYHLPLFLHSRAAHSDFVQILKDEGFGTNGGRDVGAKGGVVHSFTGTVDEVVELVSIRHPNAFEADLCRWTWGSTLGVYTSTNGAR